MTFESLHYFIEVYQRKSITVAADALHISRQCLSKAILKLEHELNIKLFERSVAGVKATSAADELYIHAVKILSEYSVLKNKMMDIASTTQKLTSKLSIGASESIITRFGDQFVEDLSLRFPEIFFDLQSIAIKNNSGFYKNHDIVIFNTLLEIHRSPKNSDRYRIEQLSKNPLYIWVKKDSPLLQSSNLNMNTLRKHPFCLIRNSLSAMDFANSFNYDTSIVVDTKTSFKNKILNGYYTIDIESNDGSLLFANIFNSNDFVSRKLDDYSHYHIAYKKELNYSYINYIKNYFNKEG